MWSLFGLGNAQDRIAIQFMSDLHLERDNYAGLQVEPLAPYLLLVGDIGRFVDFEQYRDFLATQCAQFERVLLVAGNHEFYGSSRQEGLAAAEQIVHDPAMSGKLLFMNRGRFNIPTSSITILGCTLHSYIAPDHTKLSNDFERIRDWRVADHNEEHQRDLTWLRESLATLQAEQPCRQVVIATHYAPAFEKTTHPVNENNAVSQCFSSHALEDLQDWQGCEMVKYWLFGHTHWNARFMSGSTTVTSNCLRNNPKGLSWWQKLSIYRPFDPHATIWL